MKIEKRMLDQLNIAHYTVAEKYFSRRNAVYRIAAEFSDGTTGELVYKVYLAGEPEKEYAMLCNLKGCCVPKVLAKTENALCLEYIQGKTLLECLETAEHEGRLPYIYIDALIDFLEKFYTAMPGYSYNDINFRNFIFSKGRIWGVDLEESDIGNAAEDIGWAAALLCTYRPVGTEFKRTAEKYLIAQGSERFGITPEQVMQEKARADAAIKIRRGEKESSPRD